MVNLINGTVVAFVNLLTLECLDLSNGYATDNTPIIGYNCHSGANQQWTLIEQNSVGAWPVWSVINKATGSAMDLVVGPSNPIRGFQPSASNAPGQSWRLVSAQPDFGLVMIQNTLTNTYATLLDTSVDGGHAIAGYSGSVEEAQQSQLWKVSVVG
ncbi:ricin B lectin domain-containing protein [Microdochium trichocladiopsis]|uniref:Ricin B lectin domain-containing protein n=1 Tax=Microdochium trichocladiopsis TaxID=1682393 RepID=A0A9P8XUS8_9PEZI|nr:ricin B lectin domain-containing protein [Microdochium trichocladiopsis]KAH7014143.1 ricin B lectin domain-containing protein [Microdochium trichocladiopsis]